MNKLSKLFKKQGAIIFPLGSHPFTLDECERLTRLFSKDHLPHERPTRGDKGEAGLADVSRIKKRGTSFFYPDIEQIFTLPKFQDFISTHTGIRDVFIDRLQGMIYTKDCFLNVHVDSETCEDYQYAGVLILNDQYEGGEFIVHHPTAGPQAYKPPKYSFLLTPCTLPHEVKTITAGTRQNIVMFFMEREALAKLQAV